MLNVLENVNWCNTDVLGSGFVSTRLTPSLGAQGAGGMQALLGFGTFYRLWAGISGAFPVSTHLC